MKIVFPVLFILCCCCGPFVVIESACGEKLLDVHPYNAHETSELLKRDKRQGGGGIIPFRPLFVYRQQQREMQERWKEIEARKKLRQQSIYYQSYPQTSYRRPSTTSSIEYKYPSTRYSSHNYPSLEYENYYPSYYGSYGRYDQDRNYYPYYYNEYD